MKSIESFCISLGGSLVVPNHEINVPYVNSFSILLKERISDNDTKAGVITGGGKTCRLYQTALKNFSAPDVALDEIGIDTTHLNAKVVYHAFLSLGIKTQYLKSLDNPLDKNMDAWVTGGTVPGQTSDAVMIELSKKTGIPTLINATNIPYIYEINPDKSINKDRPIKDMTWDEYSRLMGGFGHLPGENVPFGSTASQMAKDMGLTVVVLDGANLPNLGAMLSGKPFEGTRIHP